MPRKNYSTYPTSTPSIKRLPTWIQNKILYRHRITEHNQYNRQRLQPKTSPKENSTCLSRHEQSVCYNEHTHTYQQATKHHHTIYTNQIHSKLHKRSQSLHKLQQRQLKAANPQN